MGISPARHRSTPARIRTVQTILLILVSIISYGALVLPSYLSPSMADLQVGEVSPNDYQAPQTLTYESAVKTEDDQRAADNGVAAVYAPPDPSIARGQIERLRESLQYIALVRDDENSTPAQKASDIAAL